jgi:hypothetical protein
MTLPLLLSGLNFTGITRVTFYDRLEKSEEISESTSTVDGSGDQLIIELPGFGYSGRSFRGAVVGYL